MANWFSMAEKIPISLRENGNKYVRYRISWSRRTVYIPFLSLFFENYFFYGLSSCISTFQYLIFNILKNATRNIIPGAREAKRTTRLRYHLASSRVNSSTSDIE